MRQITYKYSSSDKFAKVYASETTVAMKLRNIVFRTSAVLAAVSSLVLLSYEFRGHIGQYNAAYFPNKTSRCNIMSRHVIGTSGRDGVVRDKHQAYSRDSLLSLRNVPLCDSAVRSAVDQPVLASAPPTLQASGTSRWSSHTASDKDRIM